MARRPVSTSSNGSQEGAENVNGKSRAVDDVGSDDEEEEVLRQTQAGTYDDDDAEGDGVQEADEAEGEGSPKGRKRARANTQGDARPSGVDSIKAKIEPTTLPRDVDGYIPGSIVRVQLRNFVTYDYVEFSPGPYLNMILGPNGTGKSSIACAICLGLNFPPSVLGRQSEIQSFVKLGKEDGHIEIELKGPKGRPNIVVRRTLSARSKTSQFTINGSTVTGREVNQRMQELNVQVTNLCSFLPQDKVAEFAAMTRPQLLRETQRAAGNANLTNWHDTLIESGKELKVMQEKLGVDQARLQNDQQRNANLERDVKLYQERQQLERDIEFLGLLLPFREYLEALDIYNETKQVKALKKKHAPYLELQQTFKTQFESISRRRDELKNSSKQKFTIMRTKWDEAERLDELAEKSKASLDALRKEEKDRARKIELLKERVARTENDVANPPEIEDMDVIKQEMATWRAKGQAIAERRDRLKERQREVVDRETAHKNEISEHTRRCQPSQARGLKNWDKDCGDTVEWLRANRHRFRMEVFEPAMLSITIPNQSFAASVEACFDNNSLKTFVAQCEDDYQLINRLVVDTPEALGRKGRINTWYRAQPPNQQPQPPVTHDELRRLGFDGYALDYINCPEGMKWWLKSAVGLHRTAIALDPKRVNPAEAMNVLSRDGSVSYIVGRIHNNVRRSRYGQRLAQNTTREIGNARNLAATTGELNGPGYICRLVLSRCMYIVDVEAKRRHQQAIDLAQEALKSCQEEIDQLTEQESQINAEYRASREQYASLEKELNAPPVETRRSNLKKKILGLATERADILKDYQRLMHSAMREQAECTRAGLEYLHVSAKKAAVDALCSEQKQETDEAVARYNTAEQRYHAAKLDAKEKVAKSSAKLKAASEPTRARFQALEDSGERDPRSSEELETELGALQAQLDMNMHTNAGVVEQYEQRQREIAQLSQSIEELEEKMGKVQDRIQRTRDMWEPALMQLVDNIGSRFSAAFDRIGCAGEVRVAQHEDFDKWAIEIHVKFRDKERLQLLSAERQSGGERSLTTILYLMSLTAHAKAPFSLVDEINQGMDMTYERTAHNSLVDVTCEADAGQYFLITPKLLPNLRYHKRMKVLCVNNGEWLPDNNPSGNMMSMINAYVQHRAGGGSS
ncbi:P-loop containing nucleoside triphosphate hydrolase protein [Irpex lacteus]|nr:P-loop containing nucleoside triphosphate hydrolase protein [Irpex lacteus]